MVIRINRPRSGQTASASASRRATCRATGSWYAAPRASDAAKLRRRSWVIKRVAAMAGDPAPTAVRDAVHGISVVPPGMLVLPDDNIAHGTDSRHGKDFRAPTTYSASWYAASLEAQRQVSALSANG